MKWQWQECENEFISKKRKVQSLKEERNEKVGKAENKE